MVEPGDKQPGFRFMSTEVCPHGKQTFAMALITNQEAQGNNSLIQHLPPLRLRVHSSNLSAR